MRGMMMTTYRCEISFVSQPDQILCIAAQKLDLALGVE